MFLFIIISYIITMSSKSLHKSKITKRYQIPNIEHKQKLVELQKGFVSNCKANNKPSQYNALEDKHASHYFLNRPVNKHLKRLAKVIPNINSFQAANLEPLTTQNQKMISSLNELMQTYKTKTLSNRNLQQTFIKTKDHSSSQQNKIQQKTNLHDKSSKKRIISSKLYDPYSESMKPSIQKIRKIKMDILKKKKYVILDESIKKSNEKIKQLEINESVRSSNYKDIKQRRNQSLNQCKGPKFLQKIQVENHSKHLKFLNFINKKKSELQFYHSMHNNPKRSITQI